MNRSVLRIVLLATCFAPLLVTPISVRHVAAAVVPQSCTVFLVSDGETVLGGGNEDQGAFPARAWFVPAGEGKHGRVYLGFEGVVESGMNDQGLFYDSLSAPDIDVDPEDGKPHHSGMWTMRALEVCATVDDVIAFLDSINVPGTWTDQLFFGDRNGDSIIVEGKRIVRPERNFHVCTNFVHSRTAPDEITCDRYLTAGRMLSEMETVSLDAVRDTFAATADTWHDGSGTAYTAIYDPVGSTVTIYFWRDFEHPIPFDLEAELARGPHMIELGDIAHTNRLRDDWVNEAQRELDHLIEARFDRTVDLAGAVTDLVGHYVVDPAVGVVPSPPVMIEKASIVWDSHLPRLVVVPEGVYFDLYPAGDDVWFHTNVTMKPEMDFALRRDEAGRVVGGSLTLIGLGEIPFIKVSDVPVYEPLPSMMMPPLADEESEALRQGRLSLAGWLAAGAGLLLAGLLTFLLLE